MFCCWLSTVDFIKRNENAVSFSASVGELSAAITKALHAYMHHTLNFN
jgi:hypothetical protein